MTAEAWAHNKDHWALGASTWAAVQAAKPRGSFVLHEGSPVLLDDDGTLLEAAIPEPYVQTVRDDMATHEGPCIAFGLGALHGLALASELSADGVRGAYVYEPDPGILRLALETCPLSQGWAHVYTDLGDLRLDLSNGQANPTAASVIRNPMYEARFPTQWQAFAETVQNSIDSNQMNLNCFVAKTRPWVQNMVRNGARSAGSIPAMALRSRFGGVPCFVVGAGPSLAKNVHLLGEAAKRGIVIVVDGAIGPVEDAGQPYHAIVCIESKDKTHLLARSTRAVPRLYGLSLHQTAYQTGKGLLMPFVFGHEMGAEFQVLIRSEALAAGSSVVNAAMALACIWSCAPVVYVGCDMAYTGGAQYVTGHGGGGIPNWQDSQMHVTAWGGEGTVPTRIELCHARWWIEGVMRIMPNLKLINATEGGARIQGVSEATLADVIESLPVIDVPDLAKEARKVMAPLGKEAIRKQFSREAERMADVAKRATTISHALAKASKRHLCDPDILDVVEWVGERIPAMQDAVNNSPTLRAWAKTELDALDKASKDVASADTFRLDAGRFGALARAATELRAHYLHARRDVT